MRSTMILAHIGAASASAIMPQAFSFLPRDTLVSYNIRLEARTHSLHLGSVRQLADGQNRLGDNNIPFGNFTFWPGSGLIDSHRRGCIATPGPTNQFQCDEGVDPMSDFDISCDGVLMFNGSRDFWACPVDDYGVRNIYTEPVPNQLKCIYITVTAGIVGDKLVPYAGCRESPPEPDWIWLWDKFYNNSLPVQPSTSEGVTQTTNHLKDSQHVASNATTEKLTGQLGVQSSDGRCGAPTGFHCFGKTDGPCCSPHGWCGFSALHCGAGCQGDFSICDGSSSSKASNGTSTSSMVTSTTSPTGNALHGTSSKPPSKTSSTGKASSSTSSKALSKTSSAGTVPISSASPSSKASSGSLTSSKVASTASSKAPTKASSAGKAPSSTFSKALSKTSSAGKVPSSSTSSSRKTTSSSASASLKTSATSAPKEDALSPNGQCGGDGGYSCNGFGAGSCCSSAGWCGSSPIHCGSGCQPLFGSCANSSSSATAPAKSQPSETAILPTRIPHPLPSRPEYDNGTYPSPVDCNDPANAQKCGDKFRAYGCPHDLEGTFESPRLMVAVDKAHPDKALDNRFDGTIGDEYCTLYNFEVHPSNAGKKCSLVWLFPETEEKEVEEVPVFDAHGGPNSSVLMEFWHVREPASHGLTWNGVGPRKIVAAGPVRPGFSCNAKTVPCTADFEHTFMVCGQNFSLKYAQDPKSSNPMGLYIRTC